MHVVKATVNDYLLGVGHLSSFLYYLPGHRGDHFQFLSNFSLAYQIAQGSLQPWK